LKSSPVRIGRFEILLQISGQVPDQVPTDVPGNDDGSKNYLIGMTVAILVVILGVIIALYFNCQKRRPKSSSTEANAEKTNEVIDPQYIDDDGGNYEQVDDEQSTYTALNRRGEVSDDHLYAHLYEITQNMRADQKETGF
jgi:flagellar basal body-associated protein FliL